MSTGLLPCPFCGHEPWGIFGPLREKGGTCWVECHGIHECDLICGDWHFEGTREETKVAWNTRAAASARIQELEQQLGECSVAWETGNRAVADNARLTALLAESQAALSVSAKGLMELSLEARGLGNPSVPLREDASGHSPSRSTPELALDSDGEISMDWTNAARDILTISIGPHGRLCFAYIIGDERGSGQAAISRPHAPAIFKAIQHFAEDELGQQDRAPAADE